MAKKIVLEGKKKEEEINVKEDLSTMRKLTFDSGKTKNRLKENIKLFQSFADWEECVIGSGMCYARDINMKCGNVM